MTNSLIPFEGSTDEWFISCPPLFDVCGYEEFSNVTYPTREACQKVIDNLNTALPGLLMAAREVVCCWERGDLASAVRGLDEVLKAAWAQQ